MIMTLIDYPLHVDPNGAKPIYIGRDGDNDRHSVMVFERSGALLCEFFGLGPTRALSRASSVVAILNEWADSAHEYEPVLGEPTWLDATVLGLANVLRRTG
jgi:hypothetical protein